MELKAIRTLSNSVKKVRFLLFAKKLAIDRINLLN